LGEISGAKLNRHGDGYCIHANVLQMLSIFISAFSCRVLLFIVLGIEKYGIAQNSWGLEADPLLSSDQELESLASYAVSAGNSGN